MNYKIVYSNRRTVGITVKNGEIIVKAPQKAPLTLIDQVIKKHERWIEKALEREKKRREAIYDLSETDIKFLKKAAREYFEEKCRYYAEIMSAEYEKISITSAKTRFGSCSSKRRLCFSYRLMLFPPEARDYVIVHELAHLFYMNHSKAFYNVIARYMPDYKERKKLLKY